MSAPEIARLAELVRDATGNVIAPERYASLSEALERRARAIGARGVESYVDALAAGRLANEWGPLVALVTIKESYFLRTPTQFESLTREVLPQLVANRADRRTLRIWCAACAKGEEPASVAMVLAEQPALADWRWTILATDLDEDALAAARQGLYGDRAVAQLDPGRLARFFARRGRLWELAAELREHIELRPLNLSRLPLELAERSFDLILLRNVLIYFRPVLRQRLLAEVASRLEPDGWLMLGASETIWQLADELEAVQLGDCFWYRLAGRAEAGAARAAAPRAGVVATGSGPRLALGLPSRPLRSADPTTTPNRRTDQGSPPGGRIPPTASASARISPVEVLRSAQDDMAKPVILNEVKDLGGGNEGRSDPAGPSPIAAAARALAGDRLDEARELLDRALAGDGADPAAHALAGLLADLEGRAPEALAAYRAALYVAPDLFQVRLLLADGLVRAGERSRAERHYRELLSTLAAGGGSPLALFADLPVPDREGALRRCRAALAAR